MTLDECLELGTELAKYTEDEWDAITKIRAKILEATATAKPKATKKRKAKKAKETEPEPSLVAQDEALEAEATVKPKRHRRTKAQMEAARAAEAQA